MFTREGYNLPRAASTRFEKQFVAELLFRLPGIVFWDQKTPSSVSRADVAKI